MDNPKKGAMRVWWVPQVPMKPFEIPVPNAEAGAVLLNVLAEYDAFQYLNKIKPDYSNAGGLDVFDGTEWCSWESDDYEEDPQDVYPQPSLGWCEKLS